MRFIKFYLQEGVDVWINPNNVAAVCEHKPDPEFSRIYITDMPGGFTVKGNVEDVLKRLNKWW